MWVASGRRNNEPTDTLCFLPHVTSDPLKQRGAFQFLLNNTCFTALLGDTNKHSMPYRTFKRETMWY